MICTMASLLFFLHIVFTATIEISCNGITLNTVIRTPSPPRYINSIVSSTGGLERCRCPH